MHLSVGQRRWTRRVAPLAATLAVAAAVTGVTGPWGVAATPENLLQAVNVSLAPDGSISAISTEEIDRSVRSVGAATHHYDPAATAGQLPVRVTTTWTHAGTSGTDLTQVKGAKGLVEVDVTVTDTDVTPQPVTYRVAGQPVHAYALVGPPLTVTASASLGKGSFADVDESSTGTNGVVKALTDGTTAVQWAAILAPPALGTSTTFRLVENTGDFAIPTLSVGVQPGLVTDPSTRQLVDAAFGASTSGGQLLQAEDDVISLINGLQKQIGSANALLSTVTSTLTNSAASQGLAAVRGLQSAVEQISGESTNLADALTQLDSALGQQVTTAADDATAITTKAKDQLLAQIGSPADLVVPTPSASAGGTCTVPQVSSHATTVVGALQQVLDQADAFQTVDAACKQQIVTTLDQEIGTTTDCPAAGTGPATGPTTVACILGSAASDLAGFSTRLSQQAASVQAELDPQDRPDVLDDFTTLDSAVGTAQADMAALQKAIDQLGNGVGSVTDDIDTAQQAVASAEKALTGVLTPLTADLGSVASTLSSYADVLDATDADQDTTSIAAQVRAAQSLLCGTGAGAATADLLGNDVYTALLARLDALLTGTDCSGQAVTGSLPAGFTTPVTDRLASLAGSVSTLASRLDPAAKDPDSGSVAADVRALATAVASSLDDLATADQTLTALTSSTGPGDQAKVHGALAKDGAVATALATAVADVDGLYDGTAKDGSCAAPVTSPTPASQPVNALERAYMSLCSSTDAGVTDFSTLIANTTDELTSAEQQDKDAAAAALDAKSAAENQTGALFDALSADITTSEAAGVRDATATIGHVTTATTTLATQVAAQDAAELKSALATISSATSSADRLQAEASQQLTAAVQRILDDLQNGDTGLLSFIQQSANDTSGSAHQLDGVSASGDSFSAVAQQTAAYDALMSSLEKSAQELTVPAFGHALPPGSSSTTVYVFTLAGAK